MFGHRITEDGGGGVNEYGDCDETGHIYGDCGESGQEECVRAVPR